MTKRRPRYLAYLLRLWQTEDDEGGMWRASLEGAHTGERRGFGSLAALVEFLRTRTAEVAATSPTDSTSAQNASPPEPLSLQVGVASDGPFSTAGSSPTPRQGCNGS
jgi:hypothetical protein